MNSAPSDPAADPLPAIRDSPGRLFLRFLRFGCLAWGGPVAQLDMVRHELVERERWVTPEHFRRLLGIYQALPGPEAHEMCVHLGMVARGRWGGVLAGLGFMLPGFGLMLAAAWWYARTDLAAAGALAVFLGLQPVVVALVARAAWRLGRHSLADPRLGAVALAVAGLQVLQVPFWLSLPLAGAAWVAWGERRRYAGSLLGAGALAAAIFASPVLREGRPWWPEREVRFAGAGGAAAGTAATPAAAFAAGLRTGCLTFGGAYTAIPFLQEDAVDRGGWLRRAQFLDGVAIAGVLPAPLIIFATFVGYLAGGWAGALAITAGVFLPAFAFSLLFYRRIEAALAHGRLRPFLDGVTAGVVGVIAITAAELAWVALTEPKAVGLAAAAALVLWRASGRAVIPLAVIGGGLAGALLY